MPRIGFGTYLIDNGSAAYDAVTTALELGYRHIDTAAAYDNEESVGRAVRDSGIPRDEIFVTTKLWNAEVRNKRVVQAFEKSRANLGVDYIDLYLIHWPADGYVDAWLAMEELYKQGIVRAIGVSNFHQHHIDQVMEKATVVPAVNQIECHPYLAQTPLRGYCAAREIVCESWSPLGGEGGNLLQDTAIAGLAKKHSKTPAQVVLRWIVEKGMSVNPKSTHQERMRENLDILSFRLDPDDMKVMDSLNQNRRFGPDPENFDF